MLSKNGTGVSISLEYLIQIGATAELVLDHGWPSDAIDFERGEFDALGSASDGRVAGDGGQGNNAGRKLLEFDTPV